MKKQSSWAIWLLCLNFNSSRTVENAVSKALKISDSKGYPFKNLCFVVTAFRKSVVLNMNGESYRLMMTMQKKPNPGGSEIGEQMAQIFISAWLALFYS